MLRFARERRINTPFPPPPRLCPRSGRVIVYAKATAGKYGDWPGGYDLEIALGNAKQLVAARQGSLTRNGKVSERLKGGEMEIISPDFPMGSTSNLISTEHPPGTRNYR